MSIDFFKIAAHPEKCQYPRMSVEEAQADKVAARLKWFRKFLGLNQKQMAASLGAEPPKYNNWERGRQRLTLDASLKIHDVYGVGPDFFFLARTTQLPQNVYSAWSSRFDDNIAASNNE